MTFVTFGTRSSQGRLATARLNTGDKSDDQEAAARGRQGTRPTTAYLNYLRIAGVKATQAERIEKHEFKSRQCHPGTPHMRALPHGSQRVHFAVPSGAAKSAAPAHPPSPQKPGRLTKIRQAYRRVRGRRFKRSGISEDYARLWPES